MANYLKQDLSGITRVEISGATHSPGPIKELIGQILGYGFFAAIAVAIGLLNTVLPPEAAQWVETNRGMVIGAGFFLNMISSSITQTGAFEVYVDDELIFSKLQTGHLVPTEQLASLVRARVA